MLTYPKIRREGTIYMIIYFINYDGVNCSVFHSQIYTYCDLLSRSNLKVTLINCETKLSSRDYIHKNNLKIISREKGKNFDFLIKKKLIKDIAKLIFDENQKSDKIIIHCRGIFGSYIGLEVKKQLKSQLDIKVVSDIRGAVLDEYLMRYKEKGFIFKFLLRLLIIRINNIQAVVCKSSDYIFCVSKKLEEYLKSRHKINCGVSVIPTCIEEDKNLFDPEARAKKRAEMKLENKFVVTYCGGGQNYQNPQGLVKAFININKRVEEAFFLILTRDKEVFEATLNKFNVQSSKYLIRNAPHSEVFKYLSAADCAILLRERNRVNRVACPTKFAEYINCNLPVLISADIGDLDEINHKYNICIYDDEIEVLRTKIDEINNNKENFRLAVDNYYSWKKRIKGIVSIYNEL